MAKQRITEDFVRHYRLVVGETGNSPHNLRRALDRNSEIAASVRELDRIWHVVENHRRHSRRRFIVQTDRDFPKAIGDYRERWKGALSTLHGWEDEKAGRETFNQWLDRELSNRPPQESGAVVLVDDSWDFDADEHSAALHIKGVADYLANRVDDEPFFSRAKGAFDWFSNTVGFDFSEIETRFKEFPVLIVQEHVSNEHGIEDPRSLFAYLDNIRLAYLAGANLAAIAMCRASTEILMRVHYNRDNVTELTPLIKATQQRREFDFLRKFNLLSKVREANELLHFERQDIKNKNRSRSLIREWVEVLQGMISRAPTH